MKTYTKINSQYKRYMGIRSKDVAIPNEKWRKFSNLIILGDFADPAIEFLKNNIFEATEKIDGTNSKIAFYPSTGTFKVGGKTDKSNNQQGQFEFLTEIGNRILPKLKEMFPPEKAVFRPTKGDDNLPIFLSPHIESDQIIWDNVGNKATAESIYGLQFEEDPIYIYGEYFGKGIQKAGSKYLSDHDFVVFDINIQGWWIPKEMRDDICHQLGLKQVPSLGNMTLLDAEKVVRAGFKTHIDAVDHSLLAEGIVLRSPIGLKDSHGNRIIVKVKHCDYVAYDAAKKEFTDKEFNEFNDWYHKNIENLNKQ